MKKFSLLWMVVLFMLSSCNSGKKNIKKTMNVKPLSVKNINWKQLEGDAKFTSELNKNLPLGFGAFPTRNYQSNGNGTISKRIKIEDSYFILQCVFVHPGQYNKKLFSKKKAASELVYFCILVKTNYPDTSNNVIASSRNHPTYISSGYIKSNSTYKIKWVAVQNNDKNDDISIVNMKYFDLSKNGRLVIVYPLKDGTLRFNQVNIPPLPLEELTKEIKNNANNWIDNFQILKDPNI